MFWDVLKIGYLSLFTYGLYYTYEIREANKAELKKTLGELEEHIRGMKDELNGIKDSLDKEKSE